MAFFAQKQGTRTPGANFANVMVRFRRAPFRARWLARTAPVLLIISLGQPFGAGGEGGEGAAAWAQGVAADATPAPTIARRTLASGLRVILVQKRDTPLVAVEVRVRGAGPVSETPDNNGVAHFIEHLVFKGGEGQKPGDVDAAIEALGGEMTARTTRDATQYATVVPAASWRAAAAVLAQTLLRPAFRADDVASERAVIGEEIAAAQSDPLRDGLSRLAGAVFAPDSPYRFPLMGPETNLRKFGPDDLRAYWQAHYRPSQMTLTIVGDVQAADVWAAAETLFPATPVAPVAPVAPAPVAIPTTPAADGKPSGGAARPLLVIPPAKPNAAPVARPVAPPDAAPVETPTASNKGAAEPPPADAATPSPSPAPLVGGEGDFPPARRNLVTVLIGFRGPNITSAPGDAALMDVLLPLLATRSGDNGALGAPLTRSGIALSVTADFLPQQSGDGLFYLAATGRAGDQKRLEQSVIAELTRVSQNGFDEDAIERARQNAQGARVYAEGAVETWASRLALHDVWGASDYDDKLAARTKAVTDDALRLALRRYLNPLNRFVVVVGAPGSLPQITAPIDATPSPGDATPPATTPGANAGGAKQ